MRGYNIDPIVLLTAFKNENTRVEEKTDLVKKEETVVEEENVPLPVKAPTKLYQGEVVSQRISANTAFTIAGLILLAILVVCILDARSRITRLEYMLEIMLYKDGRLTQ